MKKEKRESEIDLIKGGLTVFMITAHVIQFFSLGSKIEKSFSIYVNLTTFSGFFFIFGYVNYLAYFRKEDRKKVQKKLLKSAFELFCIYYISAYSYSFFVKQMTLSNPTDFFDILFLINIPAYSEFLLSFFLITLIAVLFLPFFQNLNNKKALYLILTCAIINVIPLGWTNNRLIELMLGSSNFALFPIIPYLPYFIIGILFAKNKIEFKYSHALISVLCTLTFFLYCIFYHKFPSRFPPNIIWILGAAAFIYFYYVFSKYIIKRISRFFIFLIKIGESTLFFLILSNILIFAISTHLKHELNSLNCLILSICIIFTIYRIKKTVK